MNPLNEKLVTGTIGELLVQLRLFQYDVQAAPPLKDSGNDLIAIRGHTFRAIQVKTTSSQDGLVRAPTDRLYHILAFVRLHGENHELFLDESEVFLITRNEIEEGLFNHNSLDRFRISYELVNSLFPPQ